MLQQAHLVPVGNVDHHRAGGAVFTHRQGCQLVGQGLQPAEHGRSVGAGLELDLHVQRQVEAGTQFGQRTQRLDATIGHHGHPIHPILQFGQDVRGEHDGQAPVTQLGQRVPEEVDGARVQTRGGLVQEQHLRVALQRLCKAQSLTHALGVGAHGAVARVFKAHLDQQCGTVGRVQPFQTGKELQGFQPAQVVP